MTLLEIIRMLHLMCFFALNEVLSLLFNSEIYDQGTL